MSRSFSVVDVPQRSQEWFAARAGRLTGSVAADAFRKNRDGSYAASRKNLLMRLCLERATGRTLEKDFQSAAMKDGIEREADAVAAFELLTGELVIRSGFLSHNELMAGCSLDGYLGDFDTLLSIKCRQPAAHWDVIKFGKIAPDAWTQMRHELMVTGARRHVYFSWNPDFKSAHQSKLIELSATDLGVSDYDRDARIFLMDVDREFAVMETLENLPAQLRKAAVA